MGPPSRADRSAPHAGRQLVESLGEVRAERVGDTWSVHTMPLALIGEAVAQFTPVGARAQPIAQIRRARRRSGLHEDMPAILAGRGGQRFAVSFVIARNFRGRDRGCIMTGRAFWRERVS